MPGLTLFDGDLGGRGPNHSSYFYGIEPSFGLGVKFNLSNHIAFRGEMCRGAYSGTDEISDNRGRHLRNLSFRSPLTSFSLIAEFSLVNWRHIRTRHLGSGNISERSNLYVFGGIGIFFFNPKAEFQGVEYELRPLGTEGQGLKIGTSFYSQYSWSIPFGVGYRFRLNRSQSLGVEVQFHKTGTDYMDDVSTVYFDNQAIRDAYGDIAAELADRRLGRNKGKANTQRGNPLENDFFLFPRVTYNHKIGAGYRGVGYGKAGKKKTRKKCPKP